MTNATRFRFTALDPNGASRSGAVAADSAKEAAEKLSKRGFTSVLVERETLSKEPERTTPLSGRRPSGYQPRLRDRLEEFTSDDSRLKLVAGVLVFLGLLLVIVLWRPTAEPEIPKTTPEASEKMAVRRLTIEARVEDWNPGDQVVFVIPALPYSWSLPVEELSDGKFFRHSLDLEFPEQATKAVISLMDSETGELKAQRTMEMSAESEQLDFGLLRH